MSEKAKRYVNLGVMVPVDLGVGSGVYVTASDYDALAQRCRELEHMLKHARMDADAHYADALTLRAEVERLQSEMEDLMFALADAEHRAENAGRNASAFEDRMGDLQVENGKLRAEVEQLRQQAARYERLRRLDPRQFAELHQRNLAGERFDDMVAGGAE